MLRFALLHVQTHNNLSQWEQRIVQMHFDPTVTQRSSNEAHHDNTDYNSPLDANGNSTAKQASIIDLLQH